MLYEVITDPLDLVRAPVRDLPEIVHTDLVQQFAQHRADAVDHFQVVLLPRITSYNVCYTKLLRGVQSR